jgi:hypothetical protein
MLDTTNSKLLRSIITSIISAAVLFAIIRPKYPELAFVALLSLVVVLISLYKFLYTKQLFYLFIGVPLFFTWVYFQSPFLFHEFVKPAYRIIPIQYIPQIAIFPALGILSMSLGYYFTFRRLSVKPICTENFKFSDSQIIKIANFFLVLGIIYRILEYSFSSILGSLSQVFQVLEFSPVIAILMGFIYYLRGGKNKVFINIMAVYFVLELLLRISETLFSSVAYLLIGLFFAFIIERKIFPVKSFIVALLICLPIFMSRVDYRRQAASRWYGGSEQLGLPSLVKLGYKYLGNIFDTWNTEKYLNSFAPDSPTRTRFEDVSYLGQCVFMTEINGTPLKYGSTFWWLPLTVVPRMVFPLKPDNLMATKVAQDYGAKGFTHGAMNFPMLVEMYINFGFWGIVVLSFFLGMFYKWVILKIDYVTGDLNFLIFLNLLWHLMRVEGNITLILGGFLQVLLFWYVIIRLIRPSILTNDSSQADENLLSNTGLIE